MQTRINLKTLATALLGPALLVACSGPREPAPPPPAAVYAPADPAPELAGGPPAADPAVGEPTAPAAPDLAGGYAAPAAPAPVFHDMAPVPNPEDLSPADRARIYGEVAKPKPKPVKMVVKGEAQAAAPVMAPPAKPVVTPPAPAPVIEKPAPAPAAVAPMHPTPPVAIAPPVSKPATPPKAAGWLEKPIAVNWAGSPFPWLVGVAILLLVLLLAMLIGRALSDGQAKARRQRNAKTEETIAQVYEEPVAQPVFATPAPAPAPAPTPIHQGGFSNPMMAAAAAGVAAAAVRVQDPAAPFHGQIAMIADPGPATAPAPEAPLAAAPILAAAVAAVPVLAANPMARLGESFASFDPLQLSTPATPPTANLAFAGLTQLEPAIHGHVQAAPVEVAALATPFAWYGPVVDLAQAGATQAADPVSWSPSGPIEDAVVVEPTAERKLEPAE